jgi:hypothetical protein
MSDDDAFNDDVWLCFDDDALMMTFDYDLMMIFWW